MEMPTANAELKELKRILPVLYWPQALLTALSCYVMAV